MVMVSGGAGVDGEVTARGQRAAGVNSLSARPCVWPTHAGMVPPIPVSVTAKITLNPFILAFKCANFQFFESG